MRYLKKFPTLTVGVAILLIAVVLLGGRSLIFSAQANAANTTNRQSANTNVANVITGNTASSTGGTAQQINATVDDGVQYITSTLSGGRYEPITVQQGIPVKWTLNAPSGSLNGCNNRIVIPEYNLQISLKTGDNVIEFTPDKSGTFAFGCWMGMIRSSIAVVGEDGVVANNTDDGSNQLPAGCCGGR
jgi:hypothetical protein